MFTSGFEKVAWGFNVKTVRDIPQMGVTKGLNNRVDISNGGIDINPGQAAAIPVQNPELGGGLDKQLQNMRDRGALLKNKGFTRGRFVGGQLVEGN